jgi:hypothetical protein
MLDSIKVRLISDELINRAMKLSKSSKESLRAFAKLHSYKRFSLKSSDPGWKSKKARTVRAFGQSLN